MKRAEAATLFWLGGVGTKGKVTKAGRYPRAEHDAPTFTCFWGEGRKKGNDVFLLASCVTVSLFTMGMVLDRE